MTANEILADIENYEKFDPVKGTVEGKTYVVVPTTTKTDKDSDVVINRHITLAHNTTLIFAGGKISGTGTLTGDNTRLIAPITQIFGEDITVDGIWVMDRALPAKQPNLPKRTLSPPKLKKTRLKKLAIRP